jgi:hypothetical protein
VELSFEILDLLTKIGNRGLQGVYLFRARAQWRVHQGVVVKIVGCSFPLAIGTIEVGAKQRGVQALKLIPHKLELLSQLDQGFIRTGWQSWELSLGQTEIVFHLVLVIIPPFAWSVKFDMVIAGVHSIKDIIVGIDIVS